VIGKLLFSLSFLPINDNISFKESCIARHNDFEVDLYDQDKIVKQSYQNMSCSMKQSMGRKIFAL